MPISDYLGAEGLTKSTKIAILNANYIKERIAKHYPVLYTVEITTEQHMNLSLIVVPLKKRVLK